MANIIGGLGNDTNVGTAGNDTISDLFGNNVFDAGAGSDNVWGGSGTDLFIHRFGENAGAKDYYDGGLGQDTLRLVFTAAEWARADVLADIASFLSYQKGATFLPFTFKSMGLTVLNIEQLQVTVDGAAVDPHAAIIGTPTVSALTEDLAVRSDGSLAASGKISIFDADPGQAYFVSHSGAAGNLGTLAFQPDGSYTYAVANSAVQYLGAGQTKVDSFTVVAADGTQKTVQFTVTGTNDAAVIGDPSVATGREDLDVNPNGFGYIDLKGKIAISDADQGQAYFVSHSGAAGNIGTLNFAPDGTYTYSVLNSAVQYLGTGQTRTDSFTVVAGDGTQKTVQFTIVGTNDAAVIGNPTVATGREDVDVNPNGFGYIDLKGTISISDADQGQAYFVSHSGAAGNLGTLNFAPDGSYTYSVLNSAVQYLGAGQVKVDSFTVVAADGTQKTVQFTVTGANDAAVIGNPSVVAVTEDANVRSDGFIVTSGTIAITDADQGQAQFQQRLDVTYNGAVVTIAGGTGNIGGLNLRADGGYDYVVTNASIQYLGAGQTKTDTFTVTALDGTTKQVSFVVTGTNDAAVIGNPTISTVTEDVSVNGNGALVASGTIAIADADQGQAYFVSSSGAAGNLGTLAFQPSGAYTYTVANNAVQYLGAGQTKVDSFTVVAADGTQKTVQFTVTGANDAAVIGTPMVALVTEDMDVNAHWGTVEASGKLAIADPDQGQASFRPMVYEYGDVAGTLGRFWIQADGTYTYAVLNSAVQYLGAGQTRVDSFTVTALDGTTKQVSFTITGTNDGPVAVADTGATTENAALTLDVLANDTDVDANHVFTLVSAKVAAQRGGVAVVNNKLAFTPGSDFDHLAAGQTQAVVVTYTMKDDQGATSTSTATITVTGTNDGPVAIADTGATAENAALTLDVLANDTDLDDGHVFTLTSVSVAAQQGSVAVVGNKLAFTPGTDFDHLAAGQTQAVVVTYTMKDDQGATSTSSATITVTGTNDGPVVSSTAAAATGTVTESGHTDAGAAVASTPVATGQLASADLDDGATASWSGSADGTYGAFAITNGGVWTYTLGNGRAVTDALAEGETRTETFLTTVTDDRGATATQVVTLTIVGTNDKPVVTSSAADAAGAVTEAGVVAGTPSASGTLISADMDHNATAAWSGSANGVYGAFAIDAAGHWGYTLDNARAATNALAAGETVTETFTASVTDDKGAVVTTPVTITITGTNDAPVAVADTAAATEDAAIVTGSVASNDGDVDHGATASFALNAPVAGLTLNANGGYRFDPANAAYQALAAGEVQTIVAGYTVTDDKGATASTTLTITITGTNDAPVAVADVASATEDAAIVTGSVATNDSDVDHGATASFALDAPVAGLTLDANGGYRFDPANAAYQALARGEVQTVVANYTVTDDHGATAASTLTITVTGTNDAPIAVADTASATEDAAIVTGSVATNDSDVDHGATRSFALDAPVAGLTLGADGRYSFDPANAAYQALAQGEVRTIVAGYTVTDDKGATASTTLTITITGTNDAPVAVADVGAPAIEDGAIVTGSVATNDSDVDHGATRSFALDAPVAGLTLASDGSYSFDPSNTAYQPLAKGEAQTIVAHYTVTDDFGATAAATLTITVSGTNDAPVVTSAAAAALGSVVEAGVLAGGNTPDAGTPSTGGQLSSGDVDHGATAAWSGSADGTYGAFTIGADGVWGYAIANDRAVTQALAAGESVTETFLATVTDDQGATATQSVTVTITGTNDAPVAVADVGAVSEDVVLTGSVATNDSDVDHGAALSFALDAPVAGLTLNADGSYRFDAGNVAYQALAVDETATVTAHYTVTDEHGATALATLTLTLTGTNDAPVAIADTGTATEDTTVTGSVATNDSDVDHNAALTFALKAPVAGLTLNADGSYSFNAGNTAYQSLAAGETATVIANYTVADAQGATASSALTITVTGTNDGPVVTSAAADAAGAVVEAGSTVAGTATAAGTLTASDVDHNATAAWSGTADGIYGSFAIDATGHWAYTLDNSRAATDGLAAGQSATETFTATVTDDHGATAQQTISIAITGSEDNRAPVAADVTVSGSSGSTGGSGIVISPYNGTGVAFDHLVDSNGDGVPDAPDASAVFSSPNGGYGIAVGDLNGDGKIDFVVAANNQIVVETNQGDVDGSGHDSFTASTVFNNNQYSYDVAVADLNGDGLLDIVRKSDNTVTILYNTGNDANGQANPFTTYSFSAASNGSSYGIAVADMNGDGRPDLIYANYYGSGAAVIAFDRGDTDGDGFDNYVQQNLYTNTNAGMGISAADLDGDGRTDLVVGRWDGQGVEVLFNRGTNSDGTISYVTKDVNYYGYVMETTLVDMNGDGRLDIVASNADRPEVQISYNLGDTDGDGIVDFAVQTISTGVYSYGLAVTDLNGDGTLDVYVPAIYNNGTGSGVLLSNLGDTDGNGQTNFSVVGVNGVPTSWDASPLATATSGRGAHEDGPIVKGSFSGTDADTGETATLTFRIETQPGEGAAINNGDGTFGFDPGAGFQDLAQGETRDVTFTYVAIDTHGAVSAPATVTVTVAGTNDAPVVTSNSAAASGSVTEAGNLNDGTVVAGTASATGTLTSADVDHGASAVWSAATTVSGTYGTFAIDAAGHWSYALDNSRPATQALAAGATVSDHFTARVTDDKGAKADQVVTVTVHGTNDSPVAVADVSGDGAGQGAVALGGSFLVATLTQNYQGQSTVTGLADGGFVVSYTTAAQFGGYQGIALQRFDASGAKVGTEITVSGAYNTSDSQPSLAALSNGGFALSWTHYAYNGGNDYENTFVQLYDAQGAAVGGPIEANSTIVYSQYESSISALGNGGFIVTFTDNSAYANGNNSQANDVRAQIFDATGAKVGGEFIVNANVTSDQTQSNVVTLASGNFVVAWADNSSGNTNVAGQMFTATGQRVGGTMALGSISNGQNDSVALTALASGGFVAAFSSYHYDGTQNYQDVHALVFDASGQQVGSEVVVNTTLIGSQYLPAISALSDGSFVVVWTDNNAYYGNNPDYARAEDVKGQLVAADGTLIGGEFVIGTAPQGGQNEAAITTLAGGQIVVTWTDNSQAYGDSDTGVVAQIYGFDQNDENEIVTIDVLKNDSDLDTGAVLSLVSVTQPAKGSVSIVDNKLVFDPGTAFDHLAKNAHETVSVTYVMQDEHGATAHTTATIIVTGTNDAPVVSGIVSGVATENGAAATLDAFAKASDVDDGTVLTAVVGTLPAGVSYDAATHSFALDTNTASLQALAAGETVTVSVGYGISDGTATTAATAQWTVTGTYDAPVVTGVVSGAATEDGAQSRLDALANAAVVDHGATLAVTDVPTTLPAGVSYDAATHSFTLNPADAAYQSLAQGQTMAVSVTYNVTDGTTTLADTVKWTVTGTNDAPVVSGPVTATALEGGAAVTLSALANASDVDAGTTLSVTNVGTLPAGVTYNAGSKTFTFDPTNAAYDSLKGGQTAVVTATYSVSDGIASVTESAKWTITGVNDAPAGTSSTVTMLEDGALTIGTGNFGFTDVDGDSLSAVKISALPTAGSLKLDGVVVTAGQSVLASDIAAGKLVFTPAANANGAGYANFTFQVQDNGGTANGGVNLDASPNTLTINVTAVNDAPTGSDATLTVNEDTALTLSAANFGFADATDSPANTLSAVRISSLPGAGTLRLNGAAVSAGQSVSAAAINAGQLTFTPAANANGTGYTSFTFQVQDNGGTANGGVDLDQSPNTLTINVTPVNDAPSGTNTTVTTLEDTGYTIGTGDFGFTDSDGNGFAAVKISALPGAGSLKLNGVAVVANQIVTVADVVAGKLVYTPVGNATTNASFTFQVIDDGGTASGGIDTDASPNTLTVAITPVNDAPAGTNGTATALEDTAYALTVANFGFTDPTDSPANTLKAVVITTLPGAGTLALNGVAVTAGQSVLATDIAAGKLTFLAAANANGAAYASFTFQVQDNGGTANGGVDTDASPNTLTINVTSVNDPVTDVTLSANTAPENVPSAVVGVLTAADVDTNDTFTYTIRSGLDGSLFTIVGNELRVSTTALDYEQAATRQVTVRATDAGGTFFDRTFTIQVLDSNEFTMTTGNDTFAPVASNDQILANSLTLNAGDKIDAGGGTDELLLFGSGTFNLNTLSSYANVETVRLINLTANTATLTLRTGAANDVIASGTGATTVTLNDKASTVTLSDGADTVTLGSGTATVNTGNGSDIVNHFAGAATINTGAQNDTIYLGSGLASVNAGADNDTVYIDANGFNGASAVDGGTGTDTLAVNGTINLTGNTLTNFEALSVQGSATLSSAQLAQFSQFGGAATAKIVVTDAALDLSGKAISNVNFYSANTTGTTFTVSSAAAALQIVGGTGNDTVQVVGAALTADQRDILFATSSVETLIDSSGTYAAPPASPGLIRLTAGADTLPTTPDSLTVNATAGTFGTNDTLDAGATGTDVLAIYGTGTFNLNSYNIAGFEEIRLINNTTTTEYLTLKTGQTVTVNATGTGNSNITLNNVASTVNTGAGSDTISGSTGAATVTTGAGGDVVFAGNGQMTVDMGADNDQAYIDYNGFNALSSFNGGTGFDYLYIYGGGRDVTSMTLQNFEYLYVGGDNIKMTAAQLGQFQQISGSGRVVVGDALVDLTNKSVSGVTFSSANATGTTFKVNSASAALQVLGGAGNDTIDAATTTLSAAQRDYIFSGTLVEKIIDSTGTYTAPALAAGTIKLTLGADTLPTSSADLTVYANAYTLNSNDSLDAGATGTDTLMLFGSGTFYLYAPAVLNGFEQIVLNNASSNQAQVYLRSGSAAAFSSIGTGGVSMITSDTATSVTLGSASDTVQFSTGSITLNTGAGNDVVYTNNTQHTIDMGADNDTVYDYSGWNNADVLNGGSGSDMLYLTQSHDLSGATITNFETLYVSSGTITEKLSAAQMTQFTNISGATGAKVSTADTILDLSGKSISSGLQFISENATGTTFKVSNATVAFQIVGGAGQDTVENTGTALTSDQRTALLNGSSVEILHEGNTFHGGSGANTIVGDASANTIYGNDGNDTIDGGAGADTLYGGTGNDIFVMRAGQANGDAILDFSGNGSAAGDSLLFYGYGTAAQGATFSQVDATHWSINSADGAIHDTITFASGTTITATDFVFG